jgi:hypothetical protein
MNRAKIHCSKLPSGKARHMEKSPTEISVTVTRSRLIHSARSSTIHQRKVENLTRFNHMRIEMMADQSDEIVLKGITEIEGRKVSQCFDQFKGESD